MWINGEWKLWTNILTTPWIYSIYLDLLEDNEQTSVIEALPEAVDSETSHSECILLTPSCIDSVSLWILEDYIKAAGNAALGESVDVESVLGVHIE